MLTIDEIKKKIAPLCREYGIERAWLFGSYARGDATEESDVDIRVEEKAGNEKLRRENPLSPFRKNAFMMGGFMMDLKETLQKDVDLITGLPENEFSNILRKNILRDEVLVYEAV